VRFTRRRFLAVTGTSAASMVLTSCTLKSSIFDVVIAGATPAGIMSARVAAMSGASVCLIENLGQVGGMLAAGGLGVTDSAHYETLGGYTAKYFQDIAAYYNNPSGAASLYAWEPHVAAKIFAGYLDKPNITALLGQTVVNVEKSGSQIRAVRLDNGNVIAGRQWIDASYEGDLMALSGVSYVLGRESSKQYGESLAGHQAGTILPISPFVDGSSSQLISWVDPQLNEKAQDGDQQIMAYQYRATLSKAADRIPFPKPADYNPDQWIGLLRLILEENLNSHRGIWSSGYLPTVVGGKVTYGMKFCMESIGAFTDCATLGWKYPDGNWALRSQIVQEHTNYQQGWMYFVANDPSIPSSVRADVNQWGMAADEFKDNNYRPYLLYIREGRRMVGQSVLIQSDVDGTNPQKGDAIGIGQWAIDCHNTGLFAATNHNAPGILVEGLIENQSQAPYQLPFRCMLPKQEEASNLAVAVCISASHIGFSSARVEPSYMIMGEAAGQAAVLALAAGTDISSVDISKLQSSLRANGSILDL
jgi:hypothetical protein